MKISGRRVGPAEIEASLLRDGRITEVAVVGIPDELRGQRVVAFVVASGDVDDIAPLPTAVANVGRAFAPTGPRRPNAAEDQERQDHASGDQGPLPRDPGRRSDRARSRHTARGHPAQALRRDQVSCGSPASSRLPLPHDRPIRAARRAASHGTSRHSQGRERGSTRGAAVVHPCGCQKLLARHAEVPPERRTPPVWGQ